MTGSEFSTERLNVVLGSSPGSVAGVVQNDAGDASAGAVVTLVPVNLPKIDNHYRSVVRDQHGQFTLKNLATGEYRLYAWNGIDNGFERAPKMLDGHKSESVEVKVTEGGRGTVSLKEIVVEE